MRYLIAALLSLAVGLAGCAAAPSSSSFGSPERTAHFLQCLPAALGAAASASAQVDAAKRSSSTDVLNALSDKAASGDVTVLATACAPYIADLVLDGNAQAKALQAKASAPKVNAP